MHAIPSSERGEVVCRQWFRFMPNTNEVPLVPDKETQYLGLPREKGSQMEMGMRHGNRQTTWFLRVSIHTLF